MNRCLLASLDIVSMPRGIIESGRRKLDGEKCRLEDGGDARRVGFERVSLMRVGEEGWLNGLYLVHFW